MGSTGKVAGGGMLINPFGLVNDGISEMFVLTENKGFLGMAAIMDEANKKGGVHVY